MNKIIELLMITVGWVALVATAFVSTVTAVELTALGLGTLVSGCTIALLNELDKVRKSAAAAQPSGRADD